MENYSVDCNIKISERYFIRGITKLEESVYELCFYRYDELFTTLGIQDRIHGRVGVIFAEYDPFDLCQVTSAEIMIKDREIFGELENYGAENCKVAMPNERDADGTVSQTKRITIAMGQEFWDRVISEWHDNQEAPESQDNAANGEPGFPIPIHGDIPTPGDLDYLRSMKWVTDCRRDFEIAGIQYMTDKSTGNVDITHALEAIPSKRGVGFGDILSQTNDWLSLLHNQSKAAIALAEYWRLEEYLGDSGPDKGLITDSEGNGDPVGVYGWHFDRIMSNYGVPPVLSHLLSTYHFG